MSKQTINPIDSHISETKEKVEKCTNEIRAVLDRFQLQLDVEVILRSGLVEPRIRLVPKPPADTPKEPENPASPAVETP